VKPASRDPGELSPVPPFSPTPESREADASDAERAGRPVRDIPALGQERVVGKEDTREDMKPHGPYAGYYHATYAIETHFAGGGGPTTGTAFAISGLTLLTARHNWTLESDPEAEVTGIRLRKRNRAGVFETLETGTIKRHDLDDDLAVMTLERGGSLRWMDLVLESDAAPKEEDAIWIVGYPGGTKAVSSTGVIRKLEYGLIHHDADPTRGVSGGAIIQQDTGRVIGVHRGDARLGRHPNLNVGLMFSDTQLKNMRK